MKKSFGARRVARKVGHEDDDNLGISPGTSGAETPQLVVNRPASLSKQKRKSALRLSFGPGEVGPDASTDEDGSAVFTPKKSNLSRLAMEKNAERISLRPSVSLEKLTLRPGVSDDRPSYSKDYLNELRQSTPSTPKDGESLAASEDENLKLALDVKTKFGPLAVLGRELNPSIPTDAEIREKKERRARMAKAPDFLSLGGDESDDERGGELLLRPKEKYAETRLIREDEDLAEGFDDFVEDGNIALGKKAEREQARRKRLEMGQMIQEAEGVGLDDASDDSEVERNEAYEAAQRRHGTYGQTGLSNAEERRPKIPPRITPVPELGAVLLKLRAGLQTIEESKAAKLRKLEELRAEKKDIAGREAWIQAQLKETGKDYERLRIEAASIGMNGTSGAMNGGEVVALRGLDSLGTTPVADVSEG